MNAQIHQPANRVTISPGAILGMHTVSPEERGLILGALNVLAEIPPGQWPTNRVHDWNSPNHIYLLDANNELRVIFERNEDGTLAIINVMTRERVEWLNSRLAQG